MCGRIGYATPTPSGALGHKKLTNERAWLEATVETDFLIAINLINKDEVANHSDKTLIEDCKKLKEAMLLDLIHVGRKGNKCADYMSKDAR